MSLAVKPLFYQQPCFAGSLQVKVEGSHSVLETRRRYRPGSAMRKISNLTYKTSKTPKSLGFFFYDERQIQYFGCKRCLICTCCKCLTGKHRWLCIHMSGLMSP